MDKKKESTSIRSTLVTVVVAVALVAVAVGMGFKKLQQEGVIGSPEAAKQKESARPEITPESSSPREADADEAEFQMWMEEEMETAAAEEETPETGDETEQAVAEETETPASSGGFQPGAMARGMAGGGWQSVWADLNLTEAEQARLREGWALAMARWQNMSPEEQRIQRERMTASWQRFQSMSDEEKEDASRELRGRFEDWRRSDSPELPDMILD